MFQEEYLQFLETKKILDILFKSKKVEIQGSGFRKTYKQCKKFKVKTEYRFTDFGFSFIFKRNSNKNVTVNGTLNVTEEKKQQRNKY